MYKCTSTMKIKKMGGVAFKFECQILKYNLESQLIAFDDTQN
jgi:hypothetical protein